MTEYRHWVSTSSSSANWTAEWSNDVADSHSTFPSTLREIMDDLRQRRRSGERPFRFTAKGRSHYRRRKGEQPDAKVGGINWIVPCSEQ
jgi:hypothetical protein